MILDGMNNTLPFSVYNISVKQVYKSGRSFLGSSFAFALAIAISSVFFIPNSSKAEDTSSSVTESTPKEMSPDFEQYDFKLKSLDGKTKVQLSEVIKKNYAVVFFWSAHCPVCDFAMPYVSLYHSFLMERNVKDVQLITISLDARVEDPLRRAIKDEFGFEILHDPMARDTKEAYELNKKGIPACYVFNKQGYIIATVFGFEKNFTNTVQDAINMDRQSQSGHSSVPVVRGET